MSTLAIRAAGGSMIVSLPKAILKTLGLHVGSALKLSLEDNKIILTPAAKELTLEEILKDSPKKKLTLTKEDKQWLNSPSVGKEQ